MAEPQAKHEGDADDLPGRERGLGDAPSQPLLGHLRAERALPARVGVGQDQRRDAPRVETIELLGQQATPRKPQDVSPFDNVRANIAGVRERNLVREMLLGKNSCKSPIKVRE